MINDDETLAKFKDYLTRKNVERVASWWLRLDKTLGDLTTKQINYRLDKLVAKGYLTKRTTDNYSEYQLAK